MKSNNVFPNLCGNNVPHIEIQILLYVNYAHDARKLRLVSNSWKDFIDTSLLDNPLLNTVLQRKHHVEAWTKHTPRRIPIEAHPAADVAQVSGDYIFICRQLSHERYHTMIYKNLELIGTSNIPMSFDPKHYYDTIIPCGDYFVQLRGTQSTYPTKSPSLAVYGRSGKDDPDFVPCQLNPKPQLEGREILGMKKINNDDKVILVCAERDTSSIVIINLLDGRETQVHTPGIYPIENIHNLFRLNYLALDAQGLVILRSRERVMQFLDYNNGEKLWTWKILKGFDLFLAIAVKNELFTCLYQEGYYRYIFILDNVNGQVINSLSMPKSAFMEINQTALTNKSLVWSCQVAKNAFTLNWLNIRDGSPEFSVGPCSASCSAQRNEHYYTFPFEIVGLVGKSRVVIAQCFCLCRQKYLAALDLLSVPTKIGSILKVDSGKTAYAADLSRSMVVVKTLKSRGLRECDFELIDFNSI